MCLWASKEATHWLLYDLTNNKVRKITATKMYRFRVENVENGKVILSAPYRGDDVLNFGKVVSDRKNQKIDYDIGWNTKVVDEGIHCYAGKNEKHFTTERTDCKDVIFIPVFIETKDIIGVNDQFELGKSGEIAAMKIHITRDTWRKIRKVILPKKEK